MGKTELAETGADQQLGREPGRGATTGPGSFPVIHHTADATVVVGVARGAIALHKTLKDNGFRWSTATASWNLPAELDEHTRTARFGEVLSTVRANGRDLTVVHQPAPTTTTPRSVVATAITGCTGSRHTDEPVMPDTDVSALWNDHISADADTRHRWETLLTTIDLVTEHLQAAELRHDLAPGLLTEIAANPAAATADERAAVAARLQQIAEQAAAAVDQIAADASRTVTDQHELASREAGVDAARRRVSEAVTTVNAGDTNGIDPAAARREWLAAIENLVPARLAADRAAAAAAARAGTVDHAAGARRRHADMGSLSGPAIVRRASVIAATQPGGPHWSDHARR